RATRNRAGLRHLVGIHVVVLAIEAQRQARYHRHNAGRPEPLDPVDVDRADLAYESQVRRNLFGGAKHSQIAATEADCGLSCSSNGGNQYLIELPSQHHHGYVAGFRIGDPQPVDEGGFAAELLQGAAQCRSSAVHDDNLVASFAQAWDRLSELLNQFLAIEGGPTNFDDEFHCSPAFSSKPNIRFMF